MPRSRLDAVRLAPKLWIGSAPPLGNVLAQHGFEVLVLCAQEIQPRSHEIPGVEVVHAGFDDAPDPLMSDLQTAQTASRYVVRTVAHGRRTLVTCAQGRNRSGLVCALALVELTGWSGVEVVEHIRSLRQRALYNDAFVEALAKVPAQSQSMSMR